MSEILSAETVVGHSINDIVRAAIPGADDGLCSHIAWGRTPYPFAPLQAKDFYRAASAYRRAKEHGLTLCEHCHRIAEPGQWECKRCGDALRQMSEANGNG